MSADAELDVENDVIVVTGHRVKDVVSFDSGGWGGFWGTFFVAPGAPWFDFPTDAFDLAGVDEPEPESEAAPEIVVTAPKDDQSGFADDGDVFNDGQAPTFDTVANWLADLDAHGVLVDFTIAADPDDPDVFVGSYETIFGDRHEFHSDGEDNYQDFLRSRVVPEPFPEFPMTFDDGGSWHFA